MLIQLKHIDKIYKAGQVDVPALIDINLQVERGEFVAIIGQSGSGKTTLLDIVGCLSRPTSGEYWLDGDHVNSLPDASLTGIRNRKIGFIFQTFHLLARKTALENVQLPLMYAGVSRKAQQDKARELLTRVGLQDRLLHYSNQLSGGQQQRVAIARALANSPPLLLADEPTGNLDSQSGKDILALFEQLHHQGQTIVMITHDPLIAERAERRITLSDGRIVADEPAYQAAPVLG
ncbi:MAG: ABC transporter ATP-binding protein [Nitrospirota bacterium]|jgi:putative ABC transport system ATP-binding protein|nr:ABC transporter ATP-binding protein [Nitrospirota bacterium]MDH4359197.1 ABC transporter ATP-binding protein [Nitrospirota bacterium]MDH5295527.1 ABC transporter ATP-binding protein [Nitrospirota bacterium]